MNNKNVTFTSTSSQYSIRYWIIVCSKRQLVKLGHSNFTREVLNIYWHQTQLEMNIVTSLRFHTTHQYMSSTQCKFTAIHIQDYCKISTFTCKTVWLALCCWLNNNNNRSTGHGFESYSGQKLRSNLGQVVHTYVLLSPNSITWYGPRNGDAQRLGR